MYAGGGGAAWGSGCTFLLVVVVVLLGSNLPAKLRSDTQGGLLDVAGPEGAGAAAGAGAEEEVKKTGCFRALSGSGGKITLSSKSARRWPHLAGTGRCRRC